jgi:hypothetical protein
LALSLCLTHSSLALRPHRWHRPHRWQRQIVEQGTAISFYFDLLGMAHSLYTPPGLWSSGVRQSCGSQILKKSQELAHAWHDSFMPIEVSIKSHFVYFVWKNE